MVGMRSAHSSTPKAGAVTRDMIGALTELGGFFGMSADELAASVDDVVQRLNAELNRPN